MSDPLAGKVDDSGELTEKEIIRAERNAGFISSRLREIQVSSLAINLLQKDCLCSNKSFVLWLVIDAKLFEEERTESSTRERSSRRASVFQVIHPPQWLL